MHRFMRAISVLFVVMVFLISSQAQHARAGKADDTLVVAFKSAILSLDYVFTVKREYVILSEMIDDGLFYTDPDSLKPVPLAAKSYERVSDTQIDVELREGITFHDGSSFSADDVVYTYRFLLDPKNKTKRGTIYGRWLKGVEKTGPYSVRFTLKYPYPLAVQALGRGVPLRKAGAYDGVEAGKIPAGNIHTGIGPYKVTEFHAGKQTTLERHEGYYQSSPKGRAKIGKVIIRTIPDWSTQQAELFSGGVNWMFSVPTDIAVNAGSLPMVKFISGPSMRVGFIILDAGGYTDPDGPLTKLEVRRALIHAIDREAIVKYLVKGQSSVIDAACHPLQFGCLDDVRKYKFDPELARRKLAEAGYPDGIKLDFWAYREKEVAEAIAADLEKAGVRVNFRYVKLPTLNKARRKRQIESYFGTWASGSVADVAAIASRHWSKNTDRDFSRDPRVSEYMNAAERVSDPAKREQLYKKALQLIADQAYWVPLYAFTLNYLTSPDVDFQAPKDGFPRLYLVGWK